MLEFKEGMNFYHLKKAITHERDLLHLPAGAIHSIHSKNSDDETLKFDPEDIVPEPEKGKIGASSKMPYFFSIAETQAGNLSTLFAFIVLCLAFVFNPPLVTFLLFYCCLLINHFLMSIDDFMRSFYFDELFILFP